jgi:beta-N-acetylhexosaminidase
VRRRRLGALAIAAGLAAIAGAVVGAGGDDESPPDAAAELPPQCAGSGPQALRALAGQRLVVRTDGTPDRELLRRAGAGEIAGAIVFPDVGEKESAIRAGLRRLQGAAASGGQPPLVVATDQEGGAVKRFPEAPPLRSPGELAALDASDARLEGVATGTFLSSLGINVNLAPVLDLPASSDSAIAFRAYGDDPRRTAELGLAFAAGLEKGGVAATAKHFPGLGRATLNTDFSPSEIDASRRELATDLRPFEQAIAHDIPLIMVGLASYPRIGAKGPAALEPSIATRLLRTQLGFEGVSITDDLEAEAVHALMDAPEAAELAAAAGTDLLLFARGAAPGVSERLARALASGRLDLGAARESCARIAALREGLR